MSYYYNYLLSLIQNFSVFGYLLISLLAFLESFAFVGLIIPGSIAVIIGGFLAAHGSLNTTILYIFVFAFGFLGDNFSFYLGKHNNISFQKNNKIFKQQILIRGRNFFEKYGAKSVFLGRFVGWIRPIIPYIAGMFELDNRVFIFWSIFSSLLWAASHIALGYFFGRTWQMVALWSTRFTMFLVVLIVFLVFLNNQYYNAPMTPDFWNSKVHNLGFEKPGSSSNLRFKHHARFWETKFITKNSMKIYVGTASFDSGIKWGGNHRIDPYIDHEREYLFKDLQSTSLIKLKDKYQIVEPNIGSDFAGNLFLTDGQVYVIIVN
jgi:membrane protein DedA with SNARE-associated domain